MPKTEQTIEKYKNKNKKQGTPLFLFAPIASAVFLLHLSRI